MPRYTFALQNSPRPSVVDADLSGPEEAREMAVFNIAEVLKDSAAHFWDTQQLRMAVTDEDGATVCSVQVEAKTED